MNIGIGQILIILLGILLFFGNLSTILKDLAQGLKIFKETLQDKSKKN
jgi:Sec-independent protein translocase protein TatA